MLFLYFDIPDGSMHPNVSSAATLDRSVTDVQCTQKQEFLELGEQL
jgi:hypothetical protein